MIAMEIPKIKVSIILPVYNVEEYLTQTLESFKEQTDTTKTDDDEEDYSTDDQNDPDLQEAIEISDSI